MRKPLVIDLYAGLGGWSEGFLADGWDVVGFDIERHQYGEQKYPAQLVIQDVLTLHGRQFRDADCIVASPPCQEYSYMAMPWSRGKQIAAALEFDGQAKAQFPEGYTGSRTKAQLTALFDACFRIQREASEAAGRHIPMVVENVRGAQPWVGMAKANFGSFYFWGDVAMVGNSVVAGVPKFGATVRAAKRSGQKMNPDGTAHPSGSWFAVADSKDRGRRTDRGKGARFTSTDCGIESGLKIGGDWFSDPKSTCRQHSSRSSSRKAASAQIAKIPFALSSHVARCLRPKACII